MTTEKEFAIRGLRAVLPHLDTLPAAVSREVCLALSVLQTHGVPTLEEIHKEFGSNWVVARRSKGIVDRYGPDVVCISPQRWEKTQRDILERRAFDPKLRESINRTKRP